jgi:hypothetical protein
MNAQAQQAHCLTAFRRIFSKEPTEVTTEDVGGFTQSVARSRQHQRSVSICESLRGNLWTATIIDWRAVTMRRALSPKIALDCACVEYEEGKVAQAGEVAP